MNAADDADAIAALMTVAAEDNTATVTFQSGDYTLTAESTQAEGENEGESTAPASAIPAIEALAAAFKIEGWTAKVGTTEISANALITDNAAKTEGLNGKSVKVTLTKDAVSDTGTTASAQADTTTGTTGDTTTTAPETFEYTITYKIVEPVTPPADETKASVANVTELTAAIANTKITEIEITERIETTLSDLENRNIKLTFSGEGVLVLTEATALPAGYTSAGETKIKYPKKVFEKFVLSPSTENVTVDGMKVTVTVNADVTAAAAPLFTALDAVNKVETEGTVALKYGDSITGNDAVQNAIKNAIETDMKNSGEHTYSITVEVAGVSQTFTVSYVFSAAPTTNPPLNN